MNFRRIGSQAARSQGHGGATNRLFPLKGVFLYETTFAHRHRSGETKVDIRGASLLPEALGDADVQSKEGAIKVDGLEVRSPSRTRAVAVRLRMWEARSRTFKARPEKAENIWPCGAIATAQVAPL